MPQNLDYWTKITEKKPYQDLEWNIPEQKTGQVNIIGGNSSSFAAVAKTADFISSTFPVKSLGILLPDALRGKIPPIPGVNFLSSTESGSFAKSSAMAEYVEAADFSIFIGDLSKNSATAIAISDAIKNSTKNVLLTRDTIDLVCPEMPNIIERENLFVVGSMAQLQKLFRAVYYPKMLLLSQPLLPVVETLHKFTLSYPITILTFHQEQIIVASHGQVATMPIENTSYAPLSLWNGELAAKIALNNLYTPGKPLEATVFSIINR